MDTLQTNHRPLRPIMDPHLHQQQHPQQQPPQVPMGWYPGQFQYQTTPPPPPPQPPQHHQQQWAPEQYGQGFNPQEMYQGQQQHYPQHQHQHPPPPPRPHHQVTNMYAQPDQAWTNPGWSTQQTWDLTGNNNVGVNNEEDWAAKARAWAASKAAMEAQQAQPQFAPPSRASEHHHVYQGHYSQPAQAQYPEVQQQSVSASSHQSVQPPQATIQTANQIQDSSSHFLNEATSSYNSDSHMSYGAKDATMTYVENASAMSSQGSLPTSSTSYTQEIPFSYTSVPGVEEQAKQRQISISPLSSPMIFQQDEHGSHAQKQSASTTQLPSQSLQPHFMYSDQQVLPVPEICNQQPGFEHVSQDYHQHQQSSYVQPLQTVAMDGQEYNGQPSSVPGWPQLGVSNPPFPSVPPAIASNHQFEQPYGSGPLPIHGHTAQLFGRVPGPQPTPGFRPSMPPIGGPFAIGPGSPSLPPGPAGMVGPPFMGDNSGIFGVPERPKKASVPSWLREELMKKKAAVVANASTQGHSSEDAFRTSESEDENHSFRKADMDTKSDSQHASDDEDIEEDEVEAARMAAINQEIKRVLTDVLLKVTDDLFDEIALEIVEEDDNNTQVKKHAVNDRVRMKTLSKACSPTSPVHPTTESAKVVVSANNIASGIEDEDDDVNSSSSQPGGNLLGLANYVSDDDDDGAGQTPQQVSSHVSEHREGSPVEEHVKEGDVGDLRPHEGHITEKAGDEKSRNGKETHLDNNSENSRIKEQAKDTVVDKDDGVSGEEPDKLKLISKANALKPMDKGKEKSQTRPTNVQDEVEFDKRRSDNSKDKDITSKGIDKNDARKSTSVVKTEDGEMRSRKGDNKEYDSFRHRKDGEKGGEREMEKDREKMKEREKSRATDKKRDKEKVQEREARKDSDRTHEKERRKEYEKEKRTTNKSDNGKRNEKERAEKNFPERRRDSKDTRKRRKRSSSVSSRGRNSKVDSYDNYNSSGPEGTENTRRRKVRSSRHSSSPSPVRSRKRQVSRSRSRSPHARHLHRRHSPYPSHEGRRKQSPSGSPVRRRRQ